MFLLIVPSSESLYRGQEKYHDLLTHCNAGDFTLMEAMLANDARLVNKVLDCAVRTRDIIK